MTREEVVARALRAVCSDDHMSMLSAKVALAALDADGWVVVPKVPTVNPIAEAAQIIDRLIGLLRGAGDFNAVGRAVVWLRANAPADAWLSVAVRKMMEQEP